jgi:hypothetical protein
MKIRLVEDELFHPERPMRGQIDIHEDNSRFFFNLANAPSILLNYPYVQSDQKFSVHLMITEKRTSKNILNNFNHLP